VEYVQTSLGPDQSQEGGGYFEQDGIADGLTVCLSGSHPLASSKGLIHRVAEVTEQPHSWDHDVSRTDGAGARSEVQTLQVREAQETGVILE
jgi:hypothetical protein